MNLNELFVPQKEFDDRIITEHNLEGQKLDKKKIVALLAELYECINEAKFFKYWSENQKPRYKIECHACKGKGKFELAVARFEECVYCDGKGAQAEPLLEEFADVVHFAISLGYQLGFDEKQVIEAYYKKNEINHKRQDKKY